MNFTRIKAVFQQVNHDIICIMKTNSEQFHVFFNFHKRCEDGINLQKVI